MKKGRGSISPSTSTGPPAKCSYKHKPPMETQKSPLMSSTRYYLFLKNAHQSKNQGGGGEKFRDLPKGNQQRAMEYHKAHIQHLLHSTGCANASFSLPLGLNRKKPALRGKSLKMFVLL